MFSYFPNDRHAISEFEKEGAKVTNSGERTKRPDASVVSQFEFFFA
jgi:hypothetical protein